MTKKLGCSKESTIVTLQEGWELYCKGKTCYLYAAHALNPVLNRVPAQGVFDALMAEGKLDLLPPWPTDSSEVTRWRLRPA